MPTRRSFVRLGATAGAVTLVPQGLAATLAPGGDRAATVPSGGTRGRFASQLGRTFVVEDGGGTPVPLVLVTVSDPEVLGAPGLEGHPECFSATFLGPASAPLRQGTHAVSNRGLGALSLFLVPTGRPDGGAQHYEAAFNCVIPS